jgi:hypothetical protein
MPDLSLGVFFLAITHFFDHVPVDAIKEALWGDQIRVWVPNTWTLK